MSEEQLRKQTEATKKKIAKSVSGKNNGMYKSGQRSYRNKVNAKPGEHVHHKDGNRANNAKSNLEKFPAKGPGRSEHEKKHLRHKNFQSSGGRKKVSTTHKATRLKGKKK